MASWTAEAAQDGCERTAIVVGAGIGGVAAGIALRAAGWRVQLLERAVTARELGFALLLAPNAVHALRALGVADAVIAGGAVVHRAEMRRADGRLLRRLDSTAVTRRLGEPTVCVLRPVLHGALLDALGREALHLGSEAANLAPGPNGVVVTLSDGRTMAGRIVVGADGVGSIVRRLLHPREAPPRPSGFVALRGVSLDTAGHLGSADGIQYFGRGMEAGAMRAGGRAVYWFVSLTARRMPPDASTAPALRRSIETAFDATFRAIVSATRDEDLRLDELLEREHLDAWGAGNVTLVGDAAHPMLPHAGQGAAQALEDAVALGRALSSDGAPADALRHYERIRAPRARAVVELARRNARLGALQGRFACWLRNQSIRLAPESALLKSIIDVGRPADAGAL